MNKRMDRRTVAKGAGVLAGVAAIGGLPAVADAAHGHDAAKPVRQAGWLLRHRRCCQPVQRRNHRQPQAQ